MVLWCVLDGFSLKWDVQNDPRFLIISIQSTLFRLLEIVLMGFDRFFSALYANAYVQISFL